MKKIGYFLIGLIIVLALIMTFAFDPMGKKYAQQYAQNLLKTPVTISQFSSSFLDKRLNIDFIEVQNPPNFNNKDAFSLDHFVLKISDETTLDLIVIDELSFDGMHFVLEQNKANVNLVTLIDNLDKASSGTTLSSYEKTQSAGNKRIKINQFNVINTTLKIDTKWLKETIKVPNINLQKFGGGNGIALSQVGQELMTAVLKNLKGALEKKGIELGKKEIKETLMRKLGVDNIKEKFNLDKIKDSLNFGGTEELKNKTKDLFKQLGF
ncbi:MAG: Phage tape measure [Candidatus Ruthia sp. Asou_11_S2]|nr:Phage tape measure [Candidatus Ruthia sp. Asou_11_S2]